PLMKLLPYTTLFRSEPPGIFGKGMADAVIAVVRIKRPAEDEPQIVGHIERRDQPERRMEPGAQLGLGKFRGERTDLGRIAREARDRKSTRLNSSHLG